MIGSVRWRFTNYGFRPTCTYCIQKYGFFPRFESKKVEFGLVEYLSLHTSKLRAKSVADEAEKIVSVEVCKLRAIQQAPNLERESFKQVVTSDSSFSRLFVLISLLKVFEIGKYIETGTQHGISASVVAASTPSGLRMYSLDVTSQPLIRREDNVEYIILTTPARKSLMVFTLSNSWQHSLFFHDSDHSFENMLFEFDWAWNYLKVTILVVDDVDMNSAFSYFCQINSLPDYRIRMDSGTTIGVIVRSTAHLKPRNGH